MRKRVFISVGDISAANYVYNIFKEGFEDYEFFGITDDRLESIGIKSIARISDISVVGLAEVLPKARKIWRTYIRTTRVLSRCHVLIACDAPGFNLRLIKTARRLGVRKVIYFISPQIWAWKPKRAKTIAQYVNDMIVILPFERDLYSKFEGRSFRVHYVGHPLVDLVNTPLSEEEIRQRLSLKGIVLNMMPGSRWNEVRKHVPLLKETLKEILRREEVEALIPTFKEFVEFIRAEIKTLPVKVITSEDIPTPAYSSMKVADFSLIASGTSSLEAGIVGSPHLVFYKVNPITYALGKFIVKVSSISLVNIISGEKIVVEKINPSAKELASLTLNFLKNKEVTEVQRKNLLKLRKMLGERGVIERLRSLFTELLS